MENELFPLLASFYGMGIKGNVEATTNWLHTIRSNAKDNSCSLKELVDSTIEKLENIYEIGGKSAILEVYMIVGKEKNKYNINKFLNTILEKLNH